MVAPHSRTNNHETFLSRPLVFLRGREIFTRGRDVNAPFRETFSISMVRHLVLPLVRLSHQKMTTENQIVKCQVRQVRLLLFDVRISQQVGVVLRQERLEGSRHLTGRQEQVAYRLRHLTGINAIEAERGTDGGITTLPSPESGLGKLRSLAADGGVDRHHDALVGLFEVDIQGIADNQQAIAVLVGKEGGIDTVVITIEVEVVHVFGPDTVAVGLMTSGITGKGSVAHPLNTVDRRVEEIGDTQFLTEHFGVVGRQGERHRLSAVNRHHIDIGTYLTVQFECLVDGQQIAVLQVVALGYTLGHRRFAPHSDGPILDKRHRVAISRPRIWLLADHKALTEEGVALRIRNSKVEDTKGCRLRKSQGIGYGRTGSTVGRERATSHRVAVAGQRPAEGDVSLQVQEVEAVDDFQLCCDGIAAHAAYKGAGVVTLQLIVVRQGRTVGIEQTVSTVVAIHLEAAVLVGVDTLVALSTVGTPFPAVVLTGEGHTLVGPFPNGTAGKTGRALYNLPLAVVILEGDAKGVTVFGEDDRTVEMLVETA